MTWKRAIFTAASAAIWAIVTAESGCLTDPQSSTSTKPPLDCQKGTYELNGRCVPFPPDLVITIDPKPYTTFPNNTNCPTFLPNPASVRAGNTFAFKNTTSRTITIIGQPNVPWVTVAPGETSGTLTFPSVNYVRYAAQGCSGGQFVGDNFYGVLNVTVG